MRGRESGSESLADEDAAVIARRRHYAEFFGDVPAPEGYGVVVGNCQAESIRLVVSNDTHPGVRVPAVHEMDAADAERLHRLLAGASFLVVQPIRDDYRGLPLGTAQLRAALPAHARTVVVPSLRYGGLQPFQAAIRVPGVDEDPPLVAYHDVRLLAEAAGLPVAPVLPPDVVRAVAEDSLAELRRREDLGVDVVASDLYAPVVADLARTVNHPGNAVFLPLGERIVAALGAPGTAVDPGRPILAGVRAPLEPWVVEAWDLDAEPRPDWIVAGEMLDARTVAEAHRGWYAAHPEFVTAAVERLAPLLRRWRAA
ncbi:WcbI family polysaccharide biosynthesis putative acetyltransferase [Microbacterium sp. IEGM 1404]|uniref:WcbI family polysaccharide biosynthesis putative acetyltransferase n=1 Tax=Microbacterium sp. IEGM 1404 TaxID=3047084 RepID=UPI0024B6EC6B|nr:WcbI family polysaccharide biosynthesis putative acetyltransferase [Microbacterium sp. IEGM 1404]MDI9891165.1 WcbI family polysaccharide biosynthesis putative acetyltransferase [Microbacterium sp. IEGM 1404]